MILHDAKGSLLHDLIGQMNQDQPEVHARRQPTDGAEDDDGGKFSLVILYLEISLREFT